MLLLLLSVLAFVYCLRKSSQHTLFVERTVGGSLRQNESDLCNLANAHLRDLLEAAPSARVGDVLLSIIMMIDQEDETLRRMDILNPAITIIRSWASVDELTRQRAIDALTLVAQQDRRGVLSALRPQAPEAHVIVANAMSDLTSASSLGAVSRRSDSLEEISARNGSLEETASNAASSSGGRTHTLDAVSTTATAGGTSMQSDLGIASFGDMETTASRSTAKTETDDSTASE
jgi:hypothetical protein